MKKPRKVEPQPEPDDTFRFKTGSDPLAAFTFWTKVIQGMLGPGAFVPDWAWKFWFPLAH